MTTPTTRRAVLGAGLGLIALPALHAQTAADFPNRPMRLIVPFPPGGSTDTIARLVAQKLSEQLGQPVVLDNKPGAGGNIGMDAGAKATPDGYTLHFCTISDSVAPALYTTLPYDFAKEILPIAHVGSTPNIFVVPPASQAKTLKDFIAMAKAKPGQIRYASSGKGTPSQLTVELFKSMSGVNIEEIPYKSSAQALTDALTGEVAMNAPGLAHGLPFIKSGRAIALAVTGGKRSPAAPDIPSIAETVPGYSAYGWHGVFVPSKTPQEIKTFITNEIREVLKEPEMRERYAVAGAEVVGSTPQEFTAFLKSEAAKWGKLMKQLGIKPD